MIAIITVFESTQREKKLRLRLNREFAAVDHLLEIEFGLERDAAEFGDESGFFVVDAERQRVLRKAEQHRDRVAAGGFLHHAGLDVALVFRLKERDALQMIEHVLRFRILILRAVAAPAAVFAQRESDDGDHVVAVEGRRDWILQGFANRLGAFPTDDALESLHRGPHAATSTHAAASADAAAHAAASAGSATAFH